MNCCELRSQTDFSACGGVVLEYRSGKGLGFFTGLIFAALGGFGELLEVGGVGFGDDRHSFG